MTAKYYLLYSRKQKIITNVGEYTLKRHWYITVGMQIGTYFLASNLPILIKRNIDMHWSSNAGNENVL